MTSWFVTTDGDEVLQKGTKGNKGSERDRGAERGNWVAGVTDVPGTSPHLACAAKLPLTPALSPRRGRKIVTRLVQSPRGEGEPWTWSKEFGSPYQNDG